MKLFKMKLFELQTDLTSFTYPVVKIMICLAIMILAFFRGKIFHFSSAWANTVDDILCFVLLELCVLCLYISIGEVFHTASNRRRASHRPANVKKMSIEAVTKIVFENDIVEIEICTDDKVFRIGASSECKYSSFVFENKLFYISSSEYETIYQFTEALNGLFPDGIIPVSKIDGLPLK